MSYFLKKTNNKKELIYKSMKAFMIQNAKVGHTDPINRLGTFISYRQKVSMIQLLFIKMKSKNSIRNSTKRNRMKKPGKYQKSRLKNFSDISH